MAYMENYKTELDSGYNGMIADLGPAVIISRTIQSLNGVGYGKLVAQGTDDKGIVTDLSNGKIVGLTVRSSTQEANNVDTYPTGSDVTVIRQGVIWVLPAANVAAGDPVFYNVNNGSLSNTGKLQLSGCRWETSAGAGKLAKLRVNLDVPTVSGE